MVSWSLALAVGDEKIDRQHQDLFKQAALFFEAVEKGEGSGKLREIIAYLDRYITEHFQTEETLMAETGFPGILFHKGEHNFFRREFKDFKKRWDQAPDQPPEAHILFNLIGEWFVSHIENTDMEFGAYLKERKG